MMKRISILSPHVANQIAAGEVIESPASVVKELLENAVDAKSTLITLDIGLAGLNHIVMSDNGVGMVEEDLPLAMMPHATSKLEVLADLSYLQTMGFRGEALASIASVAQVTVCSKTAGATHASILTCDAQGGWSVRQAARTQGTTVSVYDLFYNAPVRKKFLKSEALEYAAIEQVVRRFAWTYPEIGLKLIHNQVVKLHLAPAKTFEMQGARLKKLFGGAFFKHAHPVHWVYDDFKLEGYLSLPAYHKSQSDKQWIDLNRRMVRDKLLMMIVKKVYEPWLPPGRYPLYALHITLPSTEVDVNVHPAKHEVRFLDPRWIHDVMYRGLRETLQSVMESVSTETLSSTRHKTSAASSEFVKPQDGMVWTVLDRAHVMLEHEGAYYWVNMIQFRRCVLKEAWLQNDTSWDARPLLLPVRFELNSEASLWSSAHDAYAENFGFRLRWEDDRVYWVDAIPVMLPGLDLVYFFHRYPHITPDRDGVMRLLLDADDWNVWHLDSHEQSYWKMIWRDHPKRPWTRLLETSLYEDLCHE